MELFQSRSLGAAIEGAGVCRWERGRLARPGAVEGRGPSSWRHRCLPTPTAASGTATPRAQSLTPLKRAEIRVADACAAASRGCRERPSEPLTSDANNQELRVVERRRAEARRRAVADQ